MRGIFFVLVALNSLVANAQYTIEATKISVIDGYTNPIVVGRYVIVGESSSPVVKPGADIAIDKPAGSKLVDIWAEKEGTFQEVNLEQVINTDVRLRYVLAGEGTWRIMAFFESPSAVLRKTIELSPPAPPLVASVAAPEVTGSVGAEIKKVSPVSATGGRGAYKFSVQPPMPQGMDFNGATGEVAGMPRLAASSVHLVTVADDSGQKASASFKLTVTDKPPPPKVPDDNFDNLGRRVAGWAVGAPKRKELAAIYREAARQLDKEAGASLNSVGAYILDARGKLLNQDEVAKYSTMLAELAKEAVKRHPMPSAVAVDFYTCIAVGLEAE